MLNKSPSGKLGAVHTVSTLTGAGITEKHIIRDMAGIAGQMGRAALNCR